MKRVTAKAHGGRAARGAAGARRQYRTERARAGEGLRRGARPHRPRADQARRHREGRRGLRDRASEKPLPLLFVGVGEEHRRPAAVRRRATSPRRWLVSFSAVAKRYPGGQEALRSVSFALERGRARVRHRALGRGQVHAAQADRGDRAADLRLGARQRPERRRAQARARSPICGAISAWCSRTRSCSTTAASSTTSMLPLAFTGQPPQRSGAARARRARQGGAARAREGQSDPALGRRAAARGDRARGGQPARRCLLADEPTANLDAESAAKRPRVFLAFNQVGVTVLIATHDQALIERYRQARAPQLEAGSASREGLAAPAPPGAAPLGASRRLRRC